VFGTSPPTQEEALLAVFFHELTVFIQFWDFVQKYLNSTIFFLNKF
jgi:hypothetical protein